MKHKSRRQNQVLDAFSWRTIILATMENQVIQFSTLKDVYAPDNDFWEIVEQLKNVVVGNMDLIQSGYFMQDDYLLEGKQLCIPIGSMR